MKSAFVTVGSTHFDSLIDAALSSHTLSALRERGFTRLVVQCGDYSGDFATSGSDGRDTADSERRFTAKEGIEVEVWRFKPSLAEDFAKADLVISHAGSGTIIDVLRRGKPLIVVPNTSLLDNHQQDLAKELSKLGFLCASTPNELPDCIKSSVVDNLKPFPPMNRHIFQEILDDELGFI